MQNDPLSELLVDGHEIDRKRVVSALKGLVGIDGKTGAVVPMPRFSKLGVRSKLLACLLGRRASVLLGRLDAKSEGADPATLERESGVPGGTLRPALKVLFDGHEIGRDKGGKYSLSGHHLNGAIEHLAALDPASSETKPAISRAPRRSRSAAEGTPPEAREEKRSDSGTARTSGGRPMETLRELISDGFFDEPRLIAAVQDEMRVAKGRIVEVTSLSGPLQKMVQRGALNRRQAADGFEYFTPKRGTK